MFLSLVGHAAHSGDSEKRELSLLRRHDGGGDEGSDEGGDGGVDGGGDGVVMETKMERGV